MVFKIDSFMDSPDDAVKDALEDIHEGTGAFREKYGSKISTDCGCYGDKAAFEAEKKPDTKDNDAVRTGNWTAFADSVKSGAISVLNEVKYAMKEISQSTEENFEKKAGDSGTETREKEIGESMYKKLFPEYIEKVEEITGIKIKQEQMNELRSSVEKQDFVKLDPEETKRSRNHFNSNRDRPMSEWELHTGENWPRYDKDVLNDAGEAIRKKGQPYDAHHLIEKNFGGPDEWWNIHPASFPDQHQCGIHKAEVTKRVF